ncbi:hypothetical protein P9869_25935 [Streptomyces ossamyceticus]|nr:hypothetical protein [Streptomyces ossamyceticus]
MPETGRRATSRPTYHGRHAPAVPSSSMPRARETLSSSGGGRNRAEYAERVAR